MRIIPYLAAILGVALSSGPAAVAADGNSGEKGDLIARIHFAGTAQINADPNGAKLNEIRKLPESGILGDEIIRKLATTPFRVMNKNAANRTNDHAALMQPLVEDFFRSESYLEMRGPSNAWPELILAVKLDNARAEVWRSSLATVLADWTSTTVKDIEVSGYKGWELKKHHDPNLFRFVRAGDWVVFGWGQDDLILQPAILEKIKSTKRPAASLGKKWLDAWMDWPAFTAYHPLSLPFPLPKMELAIEGRKDFVRPELKLEFAEPLGLKPQPWKIPTNIICDPISSLTLVRGFGPWLEANPKFKGLTTEPPPNQVAIWALPQIAFETCMTLPVKDGRHYLQQIAPGLISLINSTLTERKMPGSAQFTTNMDIAIRGLPVLAPYLRATNDSTGDYLLAGIFAPPAELKPFSWSSLMGTITPNNVVYYDWEDNGERLTQWRSLSQLYFMSSLRILPKTDTPAQIWLMTIKPKLESCRTIATLTKPNELTVVRNAPVGLTGFELTCVALWLDSPEFPLAEKVEPAMPINAKDIMPRR